MAMMKLTSPDNRLSFRFPAVLLTTLACAASSPEALALINPNYTPVDLAHQSDQILHLEVGPLGSAGQLPIRVVKALKRSEEEVPAELSISIGGVDQTVLATLRKALRPDKATMALFFRGTYEGVRDDETTSPPGLLRAGREWFSLERDGTNDAWVLGADELDMVTVWSGGVDMLARVVEYALTDLDPTVPVRVGANWEDRKKLAAVEGKVHGMVTLNLSADERALFVLADSGDRLFRCGGEQRALTEITKQVELRSRSHAVVAGDFNGDHRLDLLSGSGGELTLWVRTEDGKFTAKPCAAKLEKGCIGLTALDNGSDSGAGRTAVLVSTPEAPVLLRPRGDGTFSDRGVIATAGGAFPGGQLGKAGPCLAADLDGDARPDILQPFEKGALYYRGKSGGSFEDPQVLETLKAGEGPIKSCLGDYDADGRLDVFLTSEFGCSLWHNLGQGRFLDRTNDTGEIAYLSKPRCFGASTCDINNDGRQDLLILYRSLGPQLFFNRGYSCFGYAVSLCLRDSYVFQPAFEGQQAGLVSDLDGDGAQDLALALSSGEIWAIFRATEEPPLGVDVVVDPEDPPVNVTGWFEDRCLGTWNVLPGMHGTLFGLPYPGPCTLKWKYPGSPSREAQVTIETETVGFSIGIHGGSKK
jgi:hypothetical protein